MTDPIPSKLALDIAWKLKERWLFVEPTATVEEIALTIDEILIPRLSVEIEKGSINLKRPGGSLNP